MRISQGRPARIIVSFAGVTLGVALALLLLPGCGSAGDRILEQEIERTYQIDPSTVISIRNLDGSIQVYGSSSSEVELEAIKKAYTAERLNEIKVTVAAKPGSLSIETTFPPRKKWGGFDRSGTVDYIIVVPQISKMLRLELADGELSVEGIRSGEVHANLGNGRLFNRNCFANLHSSVKTGVLAIIYDWWEPRKFFINAQIEDGNASALIPGEGSFHLVAESVTGKIVNDFTTQEERHASAVGKIDIVVGDAAQANIKIHATDGNIKVTEANP